MRRRMGGLGLAICVAVVLFGDLQGARAVADESSGGIGVSRQVAAREIVVGAGGVASIGVALAIARPGTTIRVHAGTYREQAEVRTAVTLEPYGDGPVWIDGECQRTYGVRIGVSDATVRGLGVRRTVDAGVLVDGLHTTSSVARATLDGLTIQDFDCRNQGPEYRAGIAVWYGGPGQRIVNNTIVRRVELPGELHGGKSNGIWFKSNSEHPSGGGHLIANNAISGVYDGIGGETEDDPRGGFDRDTIIERNRIDTCYDDGISVEGGTREVRVRDNAISHCAIGIANAPNLTGPVYFERNTIGEGVPGRYGNVLCFKIGDKGTGVAYYTANRCVLGPGATGWGQTNPVVNPIVARQNVIKVGRYVVEITSPIDPGTSFDGNCLMTSDPDRFIEWGTARYDDLVAFRAGAGQEGQVVNDCQ